ncbi:MAG: three-Cys-motif partner protein TcmP, partial [Chloroflexi bacterium]|nr:three-Cys-motif partner protein TcmP [Chloroflexota bacterium]
VQAIAETKKIDCWILFPLSAIARQMPKDEEPSESWALNLDRVFGDRSYWHDLYQTSPQLSMFDDEPSLERSEGSGQIADNYCRRLEEVFAKVAPTRRKFTNSRNSPMFELFFAASNPAGASVAIRIADHILKNW